MKSNYAALFAGLAGCLALQIPTAQAAKETVIYSFCSQNQGTTCSDGSDPHAGVIEVKGILYGTTLGGGAYGGGTMFALDPNTGVETLIHSFGSGTDGAGPYGGLLHVKGTFYGSTNVGGNDACNSSGCGTVYAIDGATGVEKVLYAFLGGVDGAGPFGALVSMKGTLYGTTENGGDGCVYNNCGTVFSLNPGTGAETVLYAFKGNPDGDSPLAGLAASKGVLYGTTLRGNGTTDGTVFAVNAKTGAETIVHGFSGGSDGSYPDANLIDIGGTLYGTTQGGGTHNQGTVFALDPATGAQTIIYSFAGSPDGSDPVAGLIEAKGMLYGTTGTGGTTGCPQHLGCGTVFSLDPKTGMETVLFSFHNGADGALPRAGVTYAKGTLFGTTSLGGTHNWGTVFAVKP